jgi:hypothetical protein
MLYFIFYYCYYNYSINLDISIYITVGKIINYTSIVIFITHQVFYKINYILIYLCNNLNPMKNTFYNQLFFLNIIKAY